MSFTRTHYDKDSYKQTLKESLGPGNYVLGEPYVKNCYSTEPKVRIQRNGASTISNMSYIDVDSELMNLNRQYGKAPQNRYMPNQIGDNTMPMNHMNDCQTINMLDTKLTNPPATLRSTGWNRWEYLHDDVQSHTQVPFDYNVSSRIVVKDNHRPCLPTPMAQTTVLPVGTELPQETIKHTWVEVPTSKNVATCAMCSTGKCYYHVNRTPMGWEKLPDRLSTAAKTGPSTIKQQFCNTSVTMGGPKLQGLKWT